jgi:glycosyltransferase involved in cell wall biosynthesis
MSRFLINEFTDAYLTFSKRLYAKEEKYCKGKIYLINPWMELERYNPGAKFMDMKQRWRVASDEFILGVISRIKKGRGFDVLLEGFKIALAKNPKLRLIIAGRGTKAKELAILPAERLGIKDRIIFTGYLTENYLDTIACFDAFIYLSHGSDGSCRALREAMAMGKPAIGTRMGLIPELIEEGINGIIVKNTPEALADGMLRLSSNPDACRIMGEGARKKALSEFSLNQSAEDILKIYNQILQK